MKRPSDLGDQPREALAAACHEGHDRDAERASEERDVDLVTSPLRDVVHVERQDGGHARLEDLRREVEVALEVARVGDHDGGVGPLRVGATTEQHVHRDHLVGGPRREAVRAGEVEHLHSGQPAQRAAPLVHGHAGVVPHLRVEPRERVEDRRLPGVGVADERHPARARGVSRRGNRGRARIAGHVSPPPVARGRTARPRVGATARTRAPSPRSGRPSARTGLRSRPRPA